MSNDWTNKLRDQLADYQEPVSHDLWAEIEQSLAQSKKVGDEETDVKKRPQTRYVVLKRWSVAAAIALLGVGGSYVYLHDDESGQANLAVQSSFSTASGSSRTSSAVRAEAQSAGSENAILLAENNASAHQVNRHSSGRQLNHSKSSVSFQERTVAADNKVMFAAEVEMPEQSVNAEVNGRELSVLQKQNEDSERQMAVSSNHATKPLEADGGQKLYAGRAQDGHFERSYKDKYEQNWTMNLYAENVSLGSGSDGMSNGMYASSDPLAGGGFADHGVFLAAASPLRYAMPKYVEAKHHAPLAIGAQVGIGLAPRLSLSTGVVYTRVASDFKSYGVSEFDTHQVLHYVGVPLGLNYEVWSTGGFHAYVMAGGEADFNVKNDTKVSGHKEDVKRDGVQFSGKASLGAQYDVTPQVGFYIEPGAKYYFDNGSEIENTFKDKKWNFNLQFGLRINLK